MALAAASFGLTTGDGLLRVVLRFECAVCLTCASCNSVFVASAYRDSRWCTLGSDSGRDSRDIQRQVTGVALSLCYSSAVPCCGYYSTMNRPSGTSSKFLSLLLSCRTCPLKAGVCGFPECSRHGVMVCDQAKSDRRLTSVQPLRCYLFD